MHGYFFCAATGRPGGGVAILIAPRLLKDIVAVFASGVPVP